MFSSANRVPCAPAGRTAPLLAASLALGLLGGCGGGGGSAPPPPAPVNQTPAFTSADAVTVPENRAAVFRATATDPEGSAVAFSIVGGADAARFNITPAGDLAFFTPPNFDLPTDADLNNVYLVDIAASDGQGRSVVTVAVTVTNSKEGVSVRRIGTGFANPAAMSVSGNFLLVAEKNGAIYTMDLRNGNRLLLAQIPSVSGQGVLAIAAAPDFAATGGFFVMYTNAGLLVVQEYRRNPAGTSFPQGTVLGVGAPDYAGGGWLGFDPQGNLLVATGDAGGTGDPTGSAQDDSSYLGKIIRVAPFPYTFSRIAKGLHQPVGGSVYSSVFSAGLLIGDRGQTVAEEVDFLATGASGSNFGWPFMEGYHVVRGTPPAGVVEPVTEYARLSGTGVQGTIGGAVAGNDVESISGDYVFGDRSGAIFTLPTSRTTLGNARTGTERRTADFAPDAGALDQPVAIVADLAGHLYILDGDGEVFRVDQGSTP